MFLPGNIFLSTGTLMQPKYDQIIYVTLHKFRKSHFKRNFISFSITYPLNSIFLQTLQNCFQISLIEIVKKLWKCCKKKLKISFTFSAEQENRLSPELSFLGGAIKALQHKKMMLFCTLENLQNYFQFPYNFTKFT